MSETAEMAATYALKIMEQERTIAALVAALNDLVASYQNPTVQSYVVWKRARTAIAKAEGKL